MPNGLIPAEEREGFRFSSPFDGSEHDFKSYAEWEEYHTALGQELARRMRERPDE